MEERFNKFNKYTVRLNPEENDKWVAKRREDFFKKLEIIVAKKIEADPGFRLTQQDVKKILEENSSLFGSIRYGGFMHLFSDLNHLRRKLGLLPPEE